MLTPLLMSFPRRFGCPIVFVAAEQSLSPRELALKIAGNEVYETFPHARRSGEAQMIGNPRRKLDQCRPCR